eukprot:TRINITY_DN15957_c1_g1_i9.p1 TRINITY_DN15957_c1_g1~~TRINITY_DN15957_c1_g1_i9.p1  ORF type:complete len:268 (+),score=8.88 TRINITY_DN15957_c1_g1_i9:41-844(+)
MTTPYTPVKKAGWCTDYGECDISHPPHEWINCVNNTPAVVPQFDMSSMCPEYQSLACCAFSQYQDLVKSILESAVVLQRCPACYNNFVKYFCDMTCSPNQSLFYDITGAVNGSLGLMVVNNTLITVDPDYAEVLYHSCENVHVGATGETAMNLIFGNAQTPMEFLQFLGDMDPNYPPVTSPIQIDVQYGTGINALTDQTGFYTCNSSSFAYQCSCADCPDVCTNPVPIYDSTQDIPELLDFVGAYFDPVNLGLIIAYASIMASLCLI